MLMKQDFVSSAMLGGLLGLLAGAAVMAASVGKESAEVKIENFTFAPQRVTVKAGTTVTWTNNDTATHQIVSKGDPFPGDGTIDVGETYSVTFDTPGTYDYFCGIHNSMTGSIVVS